MEDSKMQLLDWLDDLCVRFIVNLPQEELASVERICFQVEEAQWFYEDFVRPLHPQLPSLSLKDFCLRMFQHCPLFARFSYESHVAAFAEFLAYKTRVPVRGAIMLDRDMERVLLVKGWKKSASWSFPRGKINKDEPDLDCAVREVYEETGFDLAAAGLAGDEASAKFIELTMREQHIKLYVFRGVPTDVDFAPRTRKEISKIEWYRLASLPGYRKKKNVANQTQAQAQVAGSGNGNNNNNDNGNNHGEALSASKLYIVAPFLAPLKRWIAEQKRLDAQRNSNYDSVASGFEVPSEAPVQDDAYISPPGVDSASAPFALGASGHDANALAGRHETLPAGRDAAAELKRMLSIGNAPGSASVSQAAATTLPQLASPPPPQTATRSQANSLLALLKSPAAAAVAQPPADAAVVESRHQPAAALQTVTSPIYPEHQFQVNFGHSHTQPQAQPHQQMRLQPLSGGPQPQYDPRQGPAVHSGAPPPPPFSPHAGQQQQQQQQQQQPFTGHQMSLLSQFTSPQPSPQPQETLLSSRPIVPSASQLPKPKLSNHAESLLSMFKTKPAADSARSAHSPTPASNQHSQALLSALTVKSPSVVASSAAPPVAGAWNAQSAPMPMQAPPIKRASLAGLVPASIPPSRKTSMSSSQAAKSPPPPTVPFKSPWAPVAGPANPAQKSGGPADKESLLSLFKPAATASQQQQQKPIGSGRKESAPLPAELAATPSSAPATAKPAREAAKTKSVNAQPKVISILQRPQPAQESAPAPAPAIIEPQKTPPTVSQKSHGPSASRRRGARGDKSNSPRPSVAQQQHTPVQILKRPSDAPKQDMSSPASQPASRPSSRHAVGERFGRGQAQEQAQTQTQTAHKPAPQLQILKRPARKEPDEQAAPVAESGASEPSAALPSGNGKENQHQQRNKLLSLFGQQTTTTASKPLQAALDANSGTAKSAAFHPPSADIGGAENKRQPSSRVDQPLAGGLSLPLQQLKPFGQAAPPAQSQSQQASTQGQQQTPISPSDRGFLLSYLDGVVRGATK